MPDAPDGGKRIGKVWVALAALATVAAAIGIYIFLSPQQDDTRSRIVQMARGLRRLVGLEDRARKPIGVIVREIEQGDEARRAQAIFLCHELTGAELAQVFPHLIRAMKDESEMVRNAAAIVVGDLSERLIRGSTGRREGADGPARRSLARTPRQGGEIPGIRRRERSARRPATSTGRVPGRRGRTRPLQHDRSPVRVSQGTRTDRPRGAATPSDRR